MGAGGDHEAPLLQPRGEAGTVFAVGMGRPVSAEVAHPQLAPGEDQGRARDALSVRTEEQIPVDEEENQRHRVEIPAHVDEVLPDQVVGNLVVPLKLQTGLSQHRQPDVVGVVEDHVQDARVQVVSQEDGQKGERRREEGDLRHSVDDHGEGDQEVGENGVGGAQLVDGGARHHRRHFALGVDVLKVQRRRR
eukprot:CAMPEP_0113330212 /NCGR_PEP_ID=MMETSP0010_2-20120614/21458_1 /TAXON_ID=216773 ORGANISM="Corethron hystrix, Strain 308" /NCGR_SAMPLE_ID=MMETSP0010_2 /ASSEMBLY_ACC=CAM_ASM_000155 /LENGTH=191 /DNA_ID=CAMNT_0000192643 /DNA_START=1115 /DNA_END=1687 /DNA_ORIENTATION=- /assembly_acc=CAM_ASM_000155